MKNFAFKSVPALLLTLLFLLPAAPSFGQKTVSGTVTDADDGEPLPSANISIANTYRGTISNRDGRYSLTIPDSLLPATVVVRYLGYQTKRLLIGAGSDEIQNVRMEPATLELGEITVTGEDPAIRIMREVIRRKQEWRDRLETYRAEAYTRQVISNDTSIVAITESVSEAFWDREQGHREVLKSKRQTANLEAAQNFAGVSYIPNFYDDNIEIAGFDLVGVTHPDALKFYDFRLEEYRTIDDRVVYEISVTPGRKLQPLFRGTIYVLDREYALLEVSLRPNEVVDFPQPIRDFDTFYEQQFNNYGQDFWLPVDMRIEGEIKISMIGLEFPLIRFRQISQLADYDVNIPLPDSLYRKEEVFTVDSSTVNNDSLFIRAVKPVPLSGEEEQAYATLDSTATLEKAFRPSGFLSRFVDGEEEGGGRGLVSDVPGAFTPAIRFNRVEELYLGLNYTVEPSGTDRLEFRVNGGYGTGDGRWSYGAGLTAQVLDRDGLRVNLGFDYSDRTRTQYESQIYTPGYSTVTNLLGEPDYFDYYRSRGYRAFAGVELVRADLHAVIGFNREDHTSLDRNSAFDLLGRDQPLQANPGIDEGLLQSLDLAVGYNMDEGYNLGITGLNRVRLQVEHSAGALGSDFGFTRYRADIDWSIPTFYRRRLFSNTLEIKATGGTYSGTLPLQRFGIIDGSISHFGTFGGLKTLQNRPYRGEQYLMVNAEHNFRTVPFELLGLRSPVDWNWGLILFGGLGRSWISEARRLEIMNRTGVQVQDSGGVHYEAGISLNGLFGLFRLDFAQRLDEPAFIINVSVARLF